VFGHATAAEPLLRDALDRRRFLAIFADALTRHGWRCPAYCVMTTHYHLLVITPKPNLARGMQLINGVYAQSFNRRHRRSGHLFKGRYESRVVESKQHGLEVCRYIALNPVRAGACRSPEQWPWSSYAATIGVARVPAFLDVDWILAQFGDDPRSAQEAFRTFVEEAMDVAA
jgi:putative transposase